MQGLGDAEQRTIPAVLESLAGEEIDQVVCGSEHTVVLSSRREKAWSWGWFAAPLSAPVARPQAGPPARPREPSPDRSASTFRPQAPPSFARADQSRHAPPRPPGVTLAGWAAATGATSWPRAQSGRSRASPSAPSPAETPTASPSWVTAPSSVRRQPPALPLSLHPQRSAGSSSHPPPRPRPQRGAATTAGSSAWGRRRTRRSRSGSSPCRLAPPHPHPPAPPRSALAPLETA